MCHFMLTKNNPVAVMSLLIEKNCSVPTFVKSMINVIVVFG